MTHRFAAALTWKTACVNEGIANELQAHAERCSHEGDIVTTFIH